MKKLTILAVAMLALSFASCKKARTCTCTPGASTYSETHTDGSPSVNSSSSGVGSMQTVTTTKLSKKAAKGVCASGKTTRTVVNTTSGDTETQVYTDEMTCTLK